MRPAAIPIPFLFLLLLSLSLLLQTSDSICLPRGSPAPPPHTPPTPSNSSNHHPSPPPTLSIFKFYCNHTEYYDLCLKALESSPIALKSPNSSTILVALMDAVDAKTHVALSYAQTILSKPSIVGKTRELLNDCMDFYDDALDNLESAREAIRVGDIGSRDAMLSAMISTYGTCEDGFEEFSIKSPLQNWTRTLQSMTDNCLAIININRKEGGY